MLCEFLVATRTTFTCRPERGAVYLRDRSHRRKWPVFQIAWIHIAEDVRSKTPLRTIAAAFPASDSGGIWKLWENGHIIEDTDSTNLASRVVPVSEVRSEEKRNLPRIQISGGADHEKKISRPEKADSRLMLKLEAGKTDWGFEDRFPSAFSRDLYADCANQDNHATCGVRTLDPNVVRYIGMNSCDAEKDGVSEKIPRKYFDPIEENNEKMKISKH